MSAPERARLRALLSLMNSTTPRYATGGAFLPPRSCKPRIYKWGGVWRWECTGVLFRSHPAEFATWDEAVRQAMQHWFIGHVFGACCEHQDKRCRQRGPR